ncbi:hypothetical protein R1sor_023290 [Riccia sorocarpa]|uniref:Uncharacterized protein n=1 Tax=Riccia sorocarpa TaxID=122646 RepID=A0ABD3GRF2_9MARC
MAKRIPMIKFPNRRGPAVSGDRAPTPAAPPKVTPPKSSTTAAGSASVQPRRPPVSNEEIDVVLLGGAVG